MTFTTAFKKIITINFLPFIKTNYYNYYVINLHCDIFKHLNIYCYKIFWYPVIINMKTFTNIVFLCLLLFVSSLLMKQRSFLQTKFNLGNIYERAKNFRLNGQMLEADCTTKSGEVRSCRYNINRRLKLNKKSELLSEEVALWTI